MINQLASSDSQYNNALHEALQTAINGNDLISALTAFDTAQQNDRLKYTLINYGKSHATSESQGLMIHQAFSSLT